MTAVTDRPTESRVGSGGRARLRFTDTVVDIDVPAGGSVLEAAVQSGIPMVSQCEVGSCGTCIGRIVTGDVQMPEGKVCALRSAEMADGYRLLCQSQIDGDAEIELDYSQEMLSAHPRVQSAGKVSRVSWLADTVVELTVKLPKSAKLTFLAGQYVRLRVPGTDEWRSYSMASGERQRKQLTFTIRVLPTGAMSNYLRTSARVGDAIEIDGPLGSFGLAADEGPVLMIAGGTGLAPMLSMMDTLQLQRDRPLQLVFGCVHESDLFHLDELEARKSFMPDLSVRIVVDEDCQSPGIVGGANPVSVLHPDDVADPLTSAYLCGPPKMLDAARDRLIELGLPADRIHAEHFLPS